VLLGWFEVTSGGSDYVLWVAVGRIYRGRSGLPDLALTCRIVLCSGLPLVLGPAGGTGGCQVRCRCCGRPPGTTAPSDRNALSQG